MYLSDVRVLLRRWYLVLAGVLATVGLCIVTTQLVPVKYQVTARLLMLPPETSLGPDRNPYLALGGLDAISGVLANATLADTSVEKLRAQGATGSYEIVPDLASAGPVLLITVDDATAADAFETLDLLLAQMPRTLTELQRTTDVPGDSLIAAKVITRDEEANVVRKSQLRALIVVLAGGLGGTVLVTGLVDSLIARRRSRAVSEAGGNVLQVPAGTDLGVGLTSGPSVRPSQPAATQPAAERVPPDLHPPDVPDPGPRFGPDNEPGGQNGAGHTGAGHTGAGHTGLGHGGAGHVGAGRGGAAQNGAPRNGAGHDLPSSLIAPPTRPVPLRANGAADRFGNRDEEHRFGHRDEEHRFGSREEEPGPDAEDAPAEWPQPVSHRATSSEFDQLMRAAEAHRQNRPGQPRRPNRAG